MRVKLIQIDGKYPNLALMKLSAYHKSIGDEVGFNVVKPDRVYASFIFTWNKAQANGVKAWFPENMDYRLGGPGLGKPNWLPDIVEHTMPDYELYGIDHSVGFTTRGCIRECGFCVVRRLEGYFKEHAPLEEFVHPDHKKVVLYDNNFLASRKALEKLEWINNRKMKVNFSQGLDGRLVTPELAEALSKTRAYNHNWTRQCMHYAWDFYEEKTNKEIMRGFQTLIEAGVKPWRLTTYVLVGYNTTHAEDLKRALTLIEMGIQPFIMKYNNRRDDKWLNHLARWCNRLIYKSIDWEHYLESAQGHTLAPEVRAGEKDKWNQTQIKPELTKRGSRNS